MTTDEMVPFLAAGMKELIKHPWRFVPSKDPKDTGAMMANAMEFLCVLYANSNEEIVIPTPRPIPLTEPPTIAMSEAYPDAYGSRRP